MQQKRIFTRTVILVSLVSLFTDISSEMLYPIMPVYLRSIGFGFLLIGILEGLAEGIAGISKGYFGRMSDRIGRRMIFVQLGYGLSAIAKPLIALFTIPVWVFICRTIDRLGKGIRTSARDAVLSDETIPQNKGKVFGFHRGMDSVGAAIGPVMALVYLYYYPGNYREMFLLAFLPAAIGVALTFIVKDKPRKIDIDQPISARNSPFAFLKYWNEASARYKTIVPGLLIFTLFNSSDAFLLIYMKTQGLNDIQVVGIYICYNIVYALMSYPMGWLADRLSMKAVFITGLLLFAGVYLFYPHVHTIYGFAVLFFIYGIYAASTDGIAKAWISNASRKKDIGTAIGFYTALSSILTLMASALAGFIWQKWGPYYVFSLSGIAVLLLCAYFFFWVDRVKDNAASENI